MSTQVQAVGTPTATTDTALVPTLTFNNVNYELSTGVYSVIIDILFGRDVLSSARFVQLFGNKIIAADLPTQLAEAKVFWNDQIEQMGAASIDIRDELNRQADACKWLTVFEKHSGKIVGAGLPKKPVPPMIGLPGNLDDGFATTAPV